MQVKDGFYRLVSVGLGVTYLFQVFLTVGGGIKFIPLTGVTLPFVSYGGSSILVSIMIFSVLQGVSLIVADENEDDEEAEDDEEDDDKYGDNDEEDE